MGCSILCNCNIQYRDSTIHLGRQQAIHWRHIDHDGVSNTSLRVVYSTVYSGIDQRKHQSSASLAFEWGIHRGRWIPRTKIQLRGICFHLMTSSWLHQENVWSPELSLWRNDMKTLFASVRGIHWSPVSSPHKRPMVKSDIFSFLLAWTIHWISCQCFECPGLSCDVKVFVEIEQSVVV